MDCLEELSTFTLLSCAHFQRKSPEMCLKHMWSSTINCVLSRVIQVAKAHYKRADSSLNNLLYKYFKKNICILAFKHGMEI